MRLLPDALDRLRDHPGFDWDEKDKRDAREPASAQEIMLSHNVVEADREPLFHLEHLRIFRQRLRVLAWLGLVLLPLFHLFHMYAAPATAPEALWPHVLMFTVCAVYLFLAPRVFNLVWARLLTGIGYTLICTGAALVMAVLSQGPPDESAERSIQFVILASHSQILLSVVLLPLSIWESTVITAIVTTSLVWSAWWVMPDADAMRPAQIFVLATTAIFVLCMTHFQSLLRRRALDSSFDLARSAAQLQRLSILDAVTGGFNRLHLEKTLALEINRAARFSHPLAVMMFDLDNFKAVNDTQGHMVGDEVLRVVWEAAITAVRDVDTVARYGGDEFMIVLPETGTEGAHAIAERFQAIAGAQLKNHFGANCPESAVTLSIGIVTVERSDPIPITQLITLADERLYEAKRMGKNRIAV
jgi:diguanylate cyclase (GGDEF)-like protein